MRGAGVAAANLEAQATRLWANIHGSANFDEGIDFINLFVGYGDATVSPVHGPMKRADPAEIRA
jgi:hypothetical protein